MGVREYSMLEGVCAKLPSLKKDCLWELEQGSPYTAHAHGTTDLYSAQCAGRSDQCIYSARIYSRAKRPYTPTLWLASCVEFLRFIDIV